MGKFKTIKEATEHWVRSFNTIPTTAVKKLFDWESEYGDGIEMLTKEDDYMYGYPAAWGWMWTFDEILDEDWARENPDIIQQCGFVMYEHENLGIVLGIDGAGYNFYDQHWIPLYKARGLQWHEEEVSEEEGVA